MNASHHAGTDRTAALLTRTLAEEAAAVRTDPGALQQIQRRTAKTSPARSRTPWLMAAFGAGLATAAVITAVLVIGADNSSDPGPANTLPETVPSHQKIFYLGPRPGNPEGPGPADPTTLSRLFSETHTVQSAAGDQPIAAVHEFLTATPIDPDYTSGWPEGVDVTAVSLAPAAGVTTFTLEGDADISSAGDLTSGEAQTAIQALLYTGGEEPGTEKSRAVFTYNGEPVTTLLGEDVSEPVALKPEAEVRAFISVDNIVEGQTLSSPVTVQVTANAFEGTVNWRLLDESGATLDEGVANGAMGEWKRDDVTLGDLEPGTYTFEALEFSAADGDETNVDSKTFVVQ